MGIPAYFISVRYRTKNSELHRSYSGTRPGGVQLVFFHSCTRLIVCRKLWRSSIKKIQHRCQSLIVNYELGHKSPVMIATIFITGGVETPRCTHHRGVDIDWLTKGPASAKYTRYSRLPCD
jgi:hypothetical protein